MPSHPQKHTDENESKWVFTNGLSWALICRFFWDTNCQVVCSCTQKQSLQLDAFLQQVGGYQLCKCTYLCVCVCVCVCVFSFKLRTLKFGSFFLKTSLWKSCITSCFFQAQTFEGFGVLEFWSFVFLFLGVFFFPLLRLVLHAWALWTLELLCTEKAWSNADHGSSSFWRLQTLGSRWVLWELGDPDFILGELVGSR